MGSSKRTAVPFPTLSLTAAIRWPAGFASPASVLCQGHERHPEPGNDDDPHEPSRVSKVNWQNQNGHGKYCDDDHAVDTSDLFPQAFSSKAQKHTKNSSDNSPWDEKTQ
jgi:hypothetical protein